VNVPSIPSLSRFFKCHTEALTRHARSLSNHSGQAQGFPDMAILFLFNPSIRPSAAFTRRGTSSSFAAVEVFPGPGRRDEVVKDDGLALVNLSPPSFLS